MIESSCWPFSSHGSWRYDAKCNDNHFRRWFLSCTELALILFVVQISRVTKFPWSKDLLGKEKNTR
jgi:hypothetical protein